MAQGKSDQILLRNVNLLTSNLACVATADNSVFCASLLFRSDKALHGSPEYRSYSLLQARLSLSPQVRSQT